MDNIYKVVDPRVDLNKPITYAIEDGARIVTCEASTTAVGGSGGSSITFNNADPPGEDVVIDKKIIIGMTYKLTMTRVGAPLNEPVIGYELLPGAAYPTDKVRPLGTDGPRFLPIAQTTSALNVTINNAAANGQLYDYIDPLMRYNANQHYDSGELSLAPSMQDTYQNYGDFLLHGSARNPLADYGENSVICPRGAHPLIWIAQNDLGDGNPATVTTAVVYLTSFEPIFISPCDFGNGNQRGFIGVNTFRATLNTTGDITRVWCHNADPSLGGWALNSINCVLMPLNESVTFSNGISSPPPTLYFTYLTPKYNEPIPARNVYPYQSIDDIVANNARTVAAGGSSSYKTNSFKLESVPRYLYIYVREDNDSRDYTKTDTYGFIQNISITFANASQQLASASAMQLYHMSVKNGCKLSWPEWSKFTGSVVCIDFAQDMSLPDEFFVGLTNPNTQITVQVSWTNISNRTINYSVYTVPVYDGIFDISKGQAMSLSGIVSREDYLKSNIKQIDYTDAHNFYGGSFLGSLRNVSKSALPKFKEGVKSIANAAPTIAKYAAPIVAPRFAPEIQEGAEIVKALLGSGYTQKQAIKMYNDGSYMKLLKKPAAKKGGAKLSNKTLMQRALM